MSNFQCIECNQAKELLDSGAILLDIRDQNSFLANHPSKALNLNNDNFQSLLNPLAKEQPILVLCYHGISSQGAAKFIAEQGFSDLYSINGGFEAWHASYPDDVKSS
ncbi:thiosulfate sulfurtransferase GlpE [Gammaproteobacteria bacterium AS21]|jgi:thiosulfate sulfurtransferase